MNKEIEEKVKEEEWVGSEPCHPTTSTDENATHFVRSEEQARVNRTAVVPIRFTSIERDTLRSNAREAHLSISEWVRRAALHRRLPPTTVPPINIDAYQELCRIGNNLNQLMRAYHSEGGAIPEFPTLLESLRLMLKTVGMQLIGATSK